MVIAVAAGAGVAAFACGGAEDRPGLGVDAGADRTAAGPTTDASPVADAGGVDAEADAAEAGVDAGACNVRLAMPPLMDSPHVPEGTAVTYDSNPPSSGPHYPVWANFQEFTKTIEDGYLVHSMEHGAVLLLYKCDPDAGAGACDAMAAALRAVRDAVPTDPACDPGIRVRVVLAPRPANDVAVAAAAWGNTYRADCVDAPSLAAFVAAHYAKAPENTCAAGSSF